MERNEQPEFQKFLLPWREEFKHCTWANPNRAVYYGLLLSHLFLLIGGQNIPNRSDITSNWCSVILPPYS